jgi:amidohydrolase
MPKWIESAEVLLPELIRVRRHLHQHPEVGFTEEKTAAFVSEYLTDLGLTPERVGQTGVVAWIDSGRPGAVVALRADMDALPVQEQNECDYVSQHPGVMHACGHDAHTATLLGTAHFLQKHRDQWSGRVRLLFQPAEEAPPGGALDLIAAGALNDVDAVYGLHVSPDIPVGRIGVSAGPIMANSDNFRIKLTGRGGHGAAPHQTVDAVVIACQLVNNLQTVISRNVNPVESAVLTVGMISGGTRFNIVAESCELRGTVRTLSRKTQEMVRERIQALAKASADGHGATFEFEYNYGYPAVINPEAGVTIVEQVGRAVLGAEGVVQLQSPSMVGEDFGYYLREKPGAFFWLGVRGENMPYYPLHNPHFNLDESALVNGVKLFAALVDCHSRG